MSKHTICDACPWRREAAKGWLGLDMDAVDWLGAAHANDTIECHLSGKGSHCIGAATYRANVCKLPLPPNPVAAKNHDKVFSSPMEFHEHHEGSKLPNDWYIRKFSNQ